MKVRYTRAAEGDVEAIGDWIAEDSPRGAVAFIERLSRACDALASMPLAYPVEPELADLKLLKRVVGPYLVFYRVTDHVEIVRVIHGARDYALVFRDGDI
ncbi:MAG: type II toxin-antitoxin system RelE/ParE family toxin [Micropepsaceae bacterium]